MNAGPIARATLHEALDALIDKAGIDGERLDADAFWTFTAMLAQGRGLTEGLHDAGLEALRAVPESPRTTFAVRQARAYHIALLARLVLDAGRLPGQGSILPANFQHGAVVHDLRGMVAGSGGMGEGHPQILNSGRRGEAGLRREARRRLVGVVRWRMGATGATREAIWNDLMGGGRNAEKSKLDRWQAEFGGENGALCRTAFAAGQAGSRRERRDENGALVTRWDGIGTVEHPVTGERVPDPAARVQVWDYIKPRPAGWPEADFIVGNPPFIGTSRMRDALGDGYTEAIRKAYPRVPDSADFVMFWWEKAALATRVGKTRRFGFITTNSLRQTFNRQVLEPHLADPKTPLSLVFAIPDHPWVDAGEGAAVRIAMTVAAPGSVPGRLFTVTEEKKGDEANEGRAVGLSGQIGKVFADLRVGADVAGAKLLKSNEGLAHMGVKLHGMGFIVSRGEANALGLGTASGLENHIRPYANGRDLAQSNRGMMVVDLFGLSETEVQTRYPLVFQHVADTVKPERDENNRETYKRNWWVFGEPRSELRPALVGLSRYIGTTRTAKHRIFQYLPASVIAESKIVAIALADAFALAVLSSHFHERFSLAAGGWLGVPPCQGSCPLLYFSSIS